MCQLLLILCFAIVNIICFAQSSWESAETGVEETPVWAMSGPFEHHISACVGIAAWNYTG